MLIQFFILSKNRIDVYVYNQYFFMKYLICKLSFTYNSKKVKSVLCIFFDGFCLYLLLNSWDF